MWCVFTFFRVLRVHSEWALPQNKKIDIRKILILENEKVSKISTYLFCPRVVKKVEEKKEQKTYDWKKSVKKVEKKEVVEEPKQEKVQLKKPKVVDKPKEEPKPEIQLKPTPGKPEKEPETKDEIKLKPVPPKQKPEEVRRKT